MKSLYRIISLAALSASLVDPVSLVAAEGEAPPPRRPAPGGEGQGQGQGPGPRGPRLQQGQPGGFQPGRGGGMQFESVLTEEQRAKFGEEMSAQRDKTRQLNEKFMKLRRELDQALFGEKLDEDLVRKKSAELAEVEVERSLVRARAFAKIRPMLSEDQLQRIREMRPEMGRGPQGGQGEFRGPPDGVRPGGRRQQGPPPNDGGDDVLPPPRQPAK